jgi:hypothetical protein
VTEGFDRFNVTVRLMELIASAEPVLAVLHLFPAVLVPGVFQARVFNSRNFRLAGFALIVQLVMLRVNRQRDT